MNEKQLTVKEAQKLSEEHDCPMAYMNLVYQGIHYGFVKRHKNGYNWCVDRAKFLEYLEKRKETPPDGWLLVMDAARFAKISKYTMYKNVLNGNVEARRIGAGRGIWYVNPKSIGDRKYGKSCKKSTKNAARS